ncbi:RNA methyltransferase [Mycolicibacterium sp. P1-5]|nr:RNA methyltransferase [Mycolicibacterium sp. P1-5]
MFGGLAFLINGNMAVAASGQGGLMVRVPPDDTAELLTREHTEPVVMAGRGDPRRRLRQIAAREITPEELRAAGAAPDAEIPYAEVTLRFVGPSGGYRLANG